jgi:hypothetical protein
LKFSDKNIPKRKYIISRRRHPTGKHEKLSIDDLKSNLVELDENILLLPTHEPAYEGMPLLGNKCIENKFTDGKCNGKVMESLI